MKSKFTFLLLMLTTLSLQACIVVPAHPRAAYVVAPPPPVVVIHQGYWRR